MRLRILAVTIFAFAALGAFAQQSNGIIDYSPVACFRGGELPLLQMNIDREGELRAYFRRINTTDWCSVEGVNEGPLSRIVLPKFDDGDEIEYFIVVIQGRRVVSRSPRIYRAHVDRECKAASARNVLKISLSCGDEAGGIPTSMGAGFAMASVDTPNPGDPGNPDDPGNPPDPGVISNDNPNQDLQQQSRPPQ